MGKINTSLIIIVLVVVLGFISNPDREQHQTAIENHITQTIAQNEQREGTVGEELGLMLRRQFIGGVIGNNLQVKNFGLLSLGKINDRTRTIGVFGQVFMMEEVVIDFE